MTKREIRGPQERFERSGAQRLRDTRPITTRMWSAMMSEFSGVILAGGAMAMFVEPALVNVVVPASLLYAVIVMSRRVTLPLRLPQTAGIRDWNYPSPAGRRPRMAAGSIYLGSDLKGRELWISSEDGRQHASVPGTTGAGKTTALVSFLANALTHASGFVLVDGKADNKLYAEVLALARRFGREDDVLCINFMVASGFKESNTFNPFAVGNADAIGEMLSSLLGESAPGDSNSGSRGRARRHARPRPCLGARPQGRAAQHRDHASRLRAPLHLESGDEAGVRGPGSHNGRDHGPSGPGDARGHHLSPESLSRRTALL